MFLLQFALFAAFLPYKCYLYVNRMSLQVIVGLNPSPIHCCFKKTPYLCIANLQKKGA